MSADTKGDMHRSHCPAGRRSETGTALIEFTLIFPLLLVLTVAAVDFGRAFFVKNILEQAAREGVRVRAVSSSADSSLVAARVNQVAGGANVLITGIEINGPDASRQVHVRVRTDFSWIFPGVFNLFGANFTNPMPMTGEAWMRNEGSS